MAEILAFQSDLEEHLELELLENKRKMSEKLSHV